MEWATSFSVTLAASSVFSFFSAAGAVEASLAVRSAAVIFFQFFFHKNLPDFDTVSICESGRNGSGIERVDELLDERFFHISVESEKTDEGEKLEKIPVSSSGAST